MTDTNQIQANLDDARTRVRAVATQRDQQVAVLTNLQAAGQDESDIRNAIAAMDEQDNAAMAAWAAGATGAAPTFDHAARDTLNNQLSDAQVKSRAAGAAAAQVQAAIAALNGQMKVEADNLTVCAMAVLAAETKARGDDYRAALIAVEQTRAYLQTLDRFLAARQDLNNPGTTAFLPQVAVQLAQRDLFIEPVQVEAANEASAYWQSLWSQSIQVPA